MIMKKNKLKIVLIPVILLALFVVAHVAVASEVTGYLSTGISSPDLTGIVVAAPIANPVAGVYASTVSVTLTASGSSSIRYTTDGSVPTCASATYSSPIIVSSSQTIQALSCYPGGIVSTVASFLYGINNTPVAPANSSGGGSSGGGSSGGGDSSFLSADANHDGRVDVLDFVQLMANWGQTGAGNIVDFNHDNAVDIGDFVILMSQWTV